MKNLMFFLLATMIMVSCNSCEPDDLPKPPPPPPVVIKNYKITAAASDGGILYPYSTTVEGGKASTIQFEVKPFYEIVNMVDNDKPVYPTYNSYSKTYTYVINNVTSDHLVIIMFKLIVNGKLDYLTRAPWYECYSLSLLSDGTWGEWFKFDLIVKKIFYLDGRRESYWDGRLVGNGTYTLSPTELHLIGAPAYKIIKLDADSLIYTSTGQNPDGSIGSIKLFYSHVEN